MSNSPLFFFSLFHLAHLKCLGYFGARFRYLMKSKKREEKKRHSAQSLPPHYESPFDLLTKHFLLLTFTRTNNKLQFFSSSFCFLFGYRSRLRAQSYTRKSPSSCCSFSKTNSQKDRNKFDKHFHRKIINY